MTTNRKTITLSTSATSTVIATVDHEVSEMILFNSFLFDGYIIASTSEKVYLVSPGKPLILAELPILEVTFENVIEKLMEAEPSEYGFTMLMEPELDAYNNSHPQS